MTEKENRIHSLALSFLGRQQIIPNLYADQIIKGYKEGYHQAEKDLKVKEVDLEKEYEEFVVDDPIFGNFITNDTMGMKLAKHFFELGLKAQKGE